MVRITRRVFTDLAIYMIGFGMAIGIFFPFFLHFAGFPSSLAFAPWFFALCVAAGIIVGFVNILLARSVVGSRIGALVDKMRYISDHLNKDRHEDIVRNCDTGSCLLEVDSTDLLGESAKAYNTLVQSLFSSIKSELMVREFTSMLTLRLELEDLSQTTLPTLFASTSTEAGAIIMEKEGELVVIASHRIADPLKVAKSDVVSAALKTGARKLLDILKVS